jgi:cytochrome c oxidase subunit 4
MSPEAHAVATHPDVSATTFVWVWVGLVAVTSIEVFLAYEHIAPVLMLVILLGLSVIKAAMIMAYFMHLKFEKISLFLLLVPALVFCVCMILIFFFPDSIRLEQLRPH